MILPAFAAGSFRVGFVARATKTSAAFMPPVSQLVVVLFELALALSGAGCIGWLAFSKRGRAARARPAALSAWDVAVSDFLFLGWFMLSFGFVGQMLLRLFAGPLSDTASDNHTLQLLLYGTMFHLGAVLTWPVARALARRRQAAASQPPAPATSETVLQAVRGGSLTFLVAMPLALGTGFLWERFLQVVGLPTERQELVDLFAQTRSPALLAFLITLAVVLAPAAEELVFRAGIFRFLRSRPPVAVVFAALVLAAVLSLAITGLHGTPMTVALHLGAAAGVALGAILLARGRRGREALLQPTPRWVAFTVSAGLFAALHGNWVSSLPLFVLGLVFAAAYERTGRIAVPMLAHALFNLNTLLLVLSGVGG